MFKSMRLRIVVAFAALMGVKIKEREILQGTSISSP